MDQLDTLNSLRIVRSVAIEKSSPGESARSIYFVHFVHFASVVPLGCIGMLASEHFLRSLLAARRVNARRVRRARQDRGHQRRCRPPPLRVCSVYCSCTYCGECTESTEPHFCSLFLGPVYSILLYVHVPIKERCTLEG